MCRQHGVRGDVQATDSGSPLTESLILFDNKDFCHSEYKVKKYLGSISAHQ